MNKTEAEAILRKDVLAKFMCAAITGLCGSTVPYKDIPKIAFQIAEESLKLLEGSPEEIPKLPLFQAEEETFYRTTIKDFERNGYSCAILIREVEKPANHWEVWRVVANGPDHIEERLAGPVDKQQAWIKAEAAAIKERGENAKPDGKND